MKERHYIVKIDLPVNAAFRSFSAGSANLDNINTEEENIIDQSSYLTSVLYPVSQMVSYSQTLNTVLLLMRVIDFNGVSVPWLHNLQPCRGCRVHYSSGSEMDQIAASVGQSLS
eukprot:794311_1